MSKDETPIGRYMSKFTNMSLNSMSKDEALKIFNYESNNTSYDPKEVMSV